MRAGWSDDGGSPMGLVRVAKRTLLVFVTGLSFQECPSPVHDGFATNCGAHPTIRSLNVSSGASDGTSEASSQ